MGRVAAGLAVAAGAVVLATPARAVSTPTLAPGASAVPAPATPDVPVVPDDLTPVVESPPTLDAAQAEVVAEIASVRAEAAAEAVESISEQRPAAGEQERIPVISPRSTSSARPTLAVGKMAVRNAGTTTSSGQYHPRPGQYHRPRRAAPAPEERALPRPSHHASIERAIGSMKRFDKSGQICPQKLESCDSACGSNPTTNDTDIDVRIAYCPVGSGSSEPQPDPGSEPSPQPAIPAAGTRCGSRTAEAGTPNLPGDPVDAGTAGDTADSNGDIACGEEPAQPTSSTGSAESEAPTPDAPPVHAVGATSRPASAGPPPSARARTEIDIEVAAQRPTAPIRLAAGPHLASNDAVQVRVSVHHRSAARPTRPAARRASRSQMPARTDPASGAPKRRTGAIVRSAARPSSSDDSVRRSLLVIAGLALLALLLGTAATASNAGAGLVAIRSRLGSRGLSSRRIVLGSRPPKGSGRGSAEIRYRE